MTLKEEVYQAVHDYIKERVDQLIEERENNEATTVRTTYCIIELMKIQKLIYKKFADYNEKLAQEKPVRINTNVKLYGKPD